MPYILPAESKNVTIDLAKAAKKIDWETDDVRLNLSLVLKTACDWAKAGHEVAAEQLTLKDNLMQLARTEVKGGRKLALTADEAAIRVENNAVLAVWDVKSATLRQLAYAGRTVLQAKDSLAAANFQAFRAPTDNDKSFGNWLAKDWQKNLLHAPKVEALACTGRALDDGSVEVETAQRYAYLAGSILVNSIYKVYEDGTMDLSQTYTPEGDLPELPRLGVSFVADAACDNVEWYGYGPMETYPDRHRSATINWWRAKAGDQYTHYPRPQDSGNLESVAVIRLTDGTGHGISVSALDKPFSASALPYSVMDIYHASHDSDLQPSGAVYLNIDTAVLGLGNSSCGPGVLKKYAIEKKPHTLHVRIQGFRLKN